MGLWGRQVILRFGQAGGDGREFRGFRVTFDVKMSKESTPNEAIIEAYNLNPASVALAQADGAVVELYVGYDIPRLIFRGNPIEDGVRLDRKGVDRVLRLECQDGGTAYQESRVALTFSTQTSASQIFEAVAASMGLPRGTIRLPDNFVFPRGMVLNAPARDVMDRLALATGSQWFIRDGTLQFVGADEDTGEEAIVFSAKAGNLIGSPTAKDGGIEIRALLAPSLRPGKVFSLESEEYSGLYVADDVSFRGDSGWGTEFYVTASGTPRS
mgnify:CR=1 FL=1